MIESGKIRLRRTEESDLAFVIGAERDLHSSLYIGQWKLEEHRAALSDPDVLHIIIEETPGARAGYVIVTGLTDPNLSICIKRIVVVNKGGGYGKETLRLLKEWLFRNTSVHRLWLDVRTHNARAQHIYEGASFTPEGILRECVKTGDRFESLQIMSILRTEYEAGR
ncbi:RimJ/RimL family protein N-acetyltransferase [Paenibacillus forsythiae]|uniref:RimJ/RimL family protein N-acetyltransferase n=1 Tax=Paenibacillus forsythiae TaxID=365616 RepID=A0ABU3H3R7_9BACL|nr:GNAT family N-acetyltransferase [Paenibacillus forsythiae]MDT3425467.1 RimJ/RimL family protein N-acetyltransferase [Paenibacillus forsythiae]